ncbi:hypothetical protein [Halorussus marinus]|uniref:hypothetical protein n=1 Tax=Halorussus marinus TaxID=2505976 RepID=UPI00106EC72C|nr:hypothetical protein [Halorussus marinus]
MTSKWRQLLPQFVAMMLLYFASVVVLAAVGVDGFVPRMIAALTIAFGYPSVLRRFDLEPEVWRRE